MKTLLQLIRSKTDQINKSSNDMIGSPLWRKTKQLIKMYYKENGITEISFATAKMLFGLNESNNHNMLIEINKDLFNQ